MKKFILPLLLVLISTQTLQADIYKWTDKDGKVHYSATPPKEPQKNIEDIEDKIKANIGKVQPSSTYKAPTEDATDSTKKKTANKKAKDRYKGDRSTARIAYCNGLKNNIHTMENNKNGNLVKEGEKKPLTTEQVTTQLKKDKENLAKNCIGI